PDQPGQVVRARAVVIDSRGRKQQIARALHVAVAVAVYQHRRALYQGWVIRVALVEAELPAFEVLSELDAGDATEPQCLHAHSCHVARLRGAYGGVDDFRLSGV